MLKENGMTDKDCFRCDGSGKICNICGESASACSCNEEEINEYVAEFQDSNVGDCDDCGGDE